MRAISIFILTMAAAFAAFLLPGASLESSAAHRSPFSFTGDGRILFTDTHSGESLSVVYRDERGRYSDAALIAIDHILRSRGDGKKIPISLKLVELIDHIQDHFEAEEVKVVSGYRSREYNSSLRRRHSRVAHNSLHIDGKAMDIRLPGVCKVALARYARDLGAGGVGLYRSSRFVHIDVGPMRNW